MRALDVKNAQQKYNALILKLEYQNDTINFSHNPSWEIRQGIMEQDLLEREGLIEIVSC